MNIIVIVSDTFRRDHLGCYGNRGIRTPNLDQFAQKCIKFDNCYATSFPTMPMRADLFTGKLTFTYLQWGPLPREENVLAKILQNTGYTTVGVVDTPFFIRNGYGYDRGFQDFVWIPGQPLAHQRIERIIQQRKYEEDFFAPKTMIAAEKCLEYYHDKKFFLYVDTWDPHEPWDPPYWYVEPYYPGYDGRIVNPCYWEWRDRGLTENDIEIAHACYCGEITMVDQWIGRLLRKVESLGLLENTAILFTSDHGFYFGEHGFFGKLREDREKSPTGERYWGRCPLYQEITRVPLLVYVPGLKPRKTNAMVSLVDLMPTILELAQVKPPKTVQGQSFISILKGEGEIFRDFAVTSLPLYDPGEVARVVDDLPRRVKEPQPGTITTQEWTLIYGREDCPVELYNIKRDPNQVQNLFPENREVAEVLHRKFVTTLERAGTDKHKLARMRRLSNM